MTMIEIDLEIHFLEIALNSIEPLFKRVNQEIEEGIKHGKDVDSLGLLDNGDFIAGVTFTICQKYISSTISWFNLREERINKDEALKTGLLCDQTPYAQIINAAANYWKHSDEWNSTSFTPDGMILRDYDQLPKRAKKTIGILEEVIPWQDYMCANVLYELTKADNYSLLSLIPILTAWRSSVIALYKSNAKNS